jgi:hypothetical protein
MKRFPWYVLLFCLFPLIIFAQSPPLFSDYFENATMRIDYYHIADARSEIITIDKIYKQGIWAGSTVNLIDPFNLGRYYIKIYDQDNGNLIYSKGFDSYCGEYKTSGPALEGIKRTFQESAIIPYPKNNIVFTVENRDRQNQLHQLFSQVIDPTSLDIIFGGWVGGVRVYDTYISGNPNTKADLAIIGEGYTSTEEFKFVQDLNRYIEVFFQQEPYKSHKKSFNIYGVLKFSEESGTDEPRARIYKNTVLNTTFNSLGSERYLLTEDNKDLRDIAAHVPYDALLIMVNSKRYGGGGIYNFYLTFTTDNQWNEYIFLHEFGHSFTGLADEYYTSSTAYNDFYPRDIEPLEPNITAFLNPPKVKWAELLTPSIKIPTPWEKQEFDKMDIAYQTIREELNDKIAKMKREMADPDSIKMVEDESEELSRTQAEKVDKYLKNSKYYGKVGLFEGAGYSSQGLYRSMVDCIMFTKGKKPFCKVCESAISKVIDYYSE